MSEERMESAGRVLARAAETAIGNGQAVLVYVRGVERPLMARTIVMTNLTARITTERDMVKPEMKWEVALGAIVAVAAEAGDDI
jgi:hypothetical protein